MRSRQKGTTTAVDLDGVRARIERWRRTRTRRTAMPESLWSAAVSLTDSHGVYGVARALRVDYTTLKLRVVQAQAAGASAAEPQLAAFVELDAAEVLCAGASTVVQLSDGSGAHLRIELPAGRSVNVYRRVLDIPTKKTRPPSVSYLEPEEVQALLRQPDRMTRVGRAHHALILFLYNTGARVSEALDVRPRDLHLARPAQVRLRGKGRKERVCPLWRKTAEVLSDLCDAGNEPGSRLFLNARGTPLSRDGVAYILEKYAELAAAELPRIKQVRVTPHVLRHSCAVALLQAGLDVTVIRDYLGHVSIATTSRYISTNLRMKREVLEAFWNRTGLAGAGDTSWKPTPDILAFLESL